jgi:serine/threonine protein kinase
VLPRGARVAGYEVEGVLGRGGMGTVYEARQLSLGRQVALKVLALTPAMDDSFKQRFRREGRIQAAIDHPNIVTVFEAGEWEEALFIAMRLVRGPNLKELTIAGGLETERTLRILTPIADALGAAHQAGLTHRDVKPQNILVGEGDHPFLVDFGLTKGLGDTGLTRAGEFVGTIDYTAPEQIRGQDATAAADVYSLGAVLYECLTGTVPFPKHADAAVMFAQLSEPPPLVTGERPELPPAIDDVVGRAMAKDPQERYATPSELMGAAERALGKSR